MLINKTSFSPEKRGQRIKIGLISFLCLVSLNITACDILDSNRAKSKDLKPPPFNKNSQHRNISIDKAREISKSAPRKQPITVKADQGLSGSDLASPRDLNTNNLFAYGTKDNNERFVRLETTVQGLANDFKQLKPAISRLVSIEKDLDALTFQLEKLLRQEQVPMVVETAPMMKMDALNNKSSNTVKPKSAATKKSSYKPAKSYIKAGDFIHTMRVADHKGKARVVFETTEKLDYNVSIDNDERLVTISFPKGNLGSDPNSLRRFSSLFKNITQVKESSGSIIVFELAKDTKILGQERLKPGKNSSRHRFYIDFQK